MRLWSRLRARACSRTPVRTTQAQVVYVGAFIVHVEDGPSSLNVELAWSAKSETILTEDGRVWSRQEMTGPAIDRLIVDRDSSLSSGVGALLISYPVALGAQRGTLSATSPGQICELLPA